MEVVVFTVMAGALIASVPIAIALGLSAVAVKVAVAEAAQVVFDSGDNSSEYKAAAYRWLNLARSYVYNDGWWKSLVHPRQVVTTTSTRTCTPVTPRVF